MPPEADATHTLTLIFFFNVVFHPYRHHPHVVTRIGLQPAGAGVGGSVGYLGNCKEIGVPNDVDGHVPEVGERRDVRWRAARYVRATSRRQGARECMVAPVSGDRVRVRVDGDGRSHVSGLKRCASPWGCPTCAPNVRRRRAEELARLVEAAQAAGGTALLVTATMAHGRHDPLDTLLDGLGAAWRTMWAGRWANQYREQWQIVGTVRAVEVTWGARTGWHPHLHAIVILDRTLDDGELVDLWAPLIGRWQARVEQATGRRPDSLACLDVRRVDDARNISEYVTDGAGWSIGAELAAGPVKIGRSRGRWTPFALLAAGVTWGDADALALWRTYETATIGRRAIVASRGLARYQITTTDDRDAAEGPQAVDVLGEVTLDPMQWAALVALDAVPSYLTLVETWATTNPTSVPPDPVDHIRERVRDRRRAGPYGC